MTPVKAAKRMHYRAGPGRYAFCAPRILSAVQTTDERHKVTCETCLEILWVEEIAVKTSAVTAAPR